MIISSRFPVLSVLLAAGCTSGGGPALTQVSGTVTLDDKPLAGAIVRFLPQGSTEGHGGFAKTDESGKYTISAQKLNKKGLWPGEYKVFLSRLVGLDGAPLPPDAKPIETAAKETVPEQYSRAHLTPLKVTVGKDAVTYDIPLKN